MAVLIDNPVWPWRGRLWSHVASDSSFEELRDPQVVERLAAMTIELRPGRSVPSPMSSDLPDWVEDL